MPTGLLIGLAAGLASAVLYAAAGTGPVGMGGLLLFLCPLPCLIAGLGWGLRAGIVAAAASAAAALGLFGPLRAIDLLGTQTLPAVLIAHLIMLGRPAPQEAGGAMEWYPLGRVLAVASLMAGAVAGWRLFHIGGSYDAIKGAAVAFISRMFDDRTPGLEGRTFSPQDIDNIASTVAALVPAAVGSTWLIAMLFNTWLACRVTRASGLLARPWPDLLAVVPPPGFAIALALALAASWFSGPVGFYGTAITGALMTGYALIGLAIVHWNAQAHASRGLILTATYVALLVLMVPATVVLALLALAEHITPWSRMRQRARPP